MDRYRSLVQEAFLTDMTPGFFAGLVYRRTPAGEWVPDEAAVGFLIGIATLCWGAVYSTIFPAHPFNSEGFGIGLGSVAGLYNLSQGRAGRFGQGE